MNSNFGSTYCQLSFHEFLKLHEPQFSQLENGNKNRVSTHRFVGGGRDK